LPPAGSRRVTTRCATALRDTVSQSRWRALPAPVRARAAAPCSWWLPCPFIHYCSIRGIAGEQWRAPADAHDDASSVRPGGRPCIPVAVPAWRGSKRCPVLCTRSANPACEKRSHLGCAHVRSGPGACGHKRPKRAVRTGCAGRTVQGCGEAERLDQGSGVWPAGSDFWQWPACRREHERHTREATTTGNQPTQGY
jgi:hypothetical protein